MKTRNCSYLLPKHPVFDKESVPLFGSMDREHSAMLWQALYLNSYEVLSSYGNPFRIIVSEKDRGFLPPLLKIQGEIIFADLGEKGNFLRMLNDKYFGENENNLAIFADCIGFSHSELSRIFNLLNTNDDAVVLGKSVSGQVCFTGFNKYPEFLETDNYHYDYLLPQACRNNSILFTLEKFVSVNDMKDFKMLYDELSRKESLTYCSQQMHEQFTHLFIEYKEFLK